jgi:hypothetical protein
MAIAYRIWLVLVICALIFIPGRSLAGSYNYTTIGELGAIASGINNLGQIVGYDFPSKSGFLFENASYTPINYPDALLTQAFGINSSGQIVGSYRYDVDGLDRGYLAIPNGKTYDFTPIDYPDTGTKNTMARGINDSGQIVGTYQDASNFFHGYLAESPYTTADFMAIVYPGTIYSTYAYGINDSGQIVGSYSSDGTSYHGFMANFPYTVTTDFTDISYPGSGVTYTAAYDINNSEQIVGAYVDAMGTHGYLRTNSDYITIDYPGATFTAANGINDRGQIVGWYQDASGSHSFIATPEGGKQPFSLPPGFKHFIGNDTYPYPPGVIIADAMHEEKDKEVKSRVFPIY